MAVNNGLSSQQQAAMKALTIAIEALQQLPEPSDEEVHGAFEEEVKSMCNEIAAIQRQISGLYKPGMTGFIP